jgi:glucose-6-phosphate 1-dehydrogenase
MRKTFILLGATGDLAKEKILPILDKINTNVILYARKQIKSKFKSVIGDLNNFPNFKNKNLYFYLALPPDLYESTILSIQKSFANKDIHIALEKPFGTSLESAEKLAKLPNSDKFYLVDHYLAKESLINNDKKIDLNNIKSIEVAILEKENIKNRGVFYDKIGAIKDTGQNHLVNMLADFLNHKNKIEILQNLKYVDNSLIVKQYPNYKKTIGVNQNSKTETYFKAKFVYKNIDIILETGKNLPITKTYIKVNYKDGTEYELVIKPNLNETKSAHQYVIEDFLSGKNKYSLTLAEALESWKVVNQLTSSSTMKRFVNVT